jgi:hypothetical protein
MIEIITILEIFLIIFAFIICISIFYIVFMTYKIYSNYCNSYILSKNYFFKYIYRDALGKIHQKK